MGYGITILVEGPRACFTRPEMKAERVSYDVITPSAARGIIEAIYWKPAIRWQIDSIEVLNKIRFDTFRRNEVEGKLSYRAQKDAFNKGTPVALDSTSQRQQRATLYLRDVAYAIRAHFEMTSNAGPEDTPEKHYNIALRRLRKGQHFCQPVLGCREFPAKVSLLEGDAEAPASWYAGEGEHDLGYMLYDLDFTDPESPMPLFFHAVMHDGVIDVASARDEVIA
ncbi:MAG: type I-C CRISPR-associated protein Cas5c [Collinsella sp.]|nr:type I-C CRISPR-associated protein Cas5c [Collinsella sp.]